MADFSVRRLDAPYDRQWNSFVEKSNNGTIFHRLDFLSYHQGRFQKEEHPLVILKGTSLHGVLPCAVFEENGEKVVRSPYGGSFGGPAFLNALTYNESRHIIEGVLDYWKEEGASRIFLTPTPGFYETSFSETFSFCLLELGFQLVNQDIAHSVDLTAEIDKTLTARARNMISKGGRQGFHLESHASIDDFFSVLNKTYNKLNKQPTHTSREFSELNRMFPDRIFADVLYLKKDPVAAIGFFLANSRVALAFYMATDPEHQEKQGQSLLIYESLRRLKEQKFHYADFGTSSLRMKANPKLFLFKESFGATGHFRNTYLFEQ